MNKIFAPEQPQSKAWVVFSGQTDMRWLKVLKPDFRHCYVILHDGEHWASVDPMSSYMDVMIHQLPSEFDLPLWLKDRGLHVVPASVSREAKQAPLMMFTCVEAVKRILGIHKRWIITPWQLYRHLSKTNEANLHTYYKGEKAWAV